MVDTSLNASFDEDHAVLNSSNAWCSLNLDTFQYLAVILGENTSFLSKKYVLVWQSFIFSCGPLKKLLLRL